MQPPETKAGPGVAAPEPRCIAQQANAVSGYSQTGRDGNPIRSGSERTGTTPAARQGQSGLECAISAFAGKRWPSDTGRLHIGTQKAAFGATGASAPACSICSSHRRVALRSGIPCRGIPGWVHRSTPCARMGWQYRLSLRDRIATRAIVSQCKLIGDNTPGDDRPGRLINNQRNIKRRWPWRIMASPLRRLAIRQARRACAGGRAELQGRDVLRAALVGRWRNHPNREGRDNPTG